MLDMRLPDGDGLDLLTRFQELAPEIQVVIITAFADVDNAVKHQHWRQRQLRITGAKQTAMTALEEFFSGKAGTLFELCVI